MNTRQDSGNSFLKTWLLQAAAFLFFAGSFFSRLSQPVGADELNWLVAPLGQFHTGFPVFYLAPETPMACSPHAYLNFITGLFHLFGPGENTARLAGLMCGLAALAGTGFIARKIIKNGPFFKESAALPAVLLSATPAFIQSALITDIDNTLLIPCILLVVYFFYCAEDKQGFLFYAGLGLAVALNLWCRITTPVLVCGAALLFLYADPARGLKTKLRSTAAVAFGGLLFILTWFPYAETRHMPFATPFEYTFDAFNARTQGRGGLRLTGLFHNTVHLLLWFGIFPCLFFAAAALQRLRLFFSEHRLEREDLFLLLGLFLTCGYVVVGGTPFGFPKYQMPGLALLILYSCFFSFRSVPENFRGSAFPLLAITLPAALAQFFIAGDWLYLVRFEMRQAALQGVSGAAILKNHAPQLAVFFSACALSALAGRKKGLGWMLIFFWLGLGTSIGAALRQNASTYQTGYAYGTHGAKAAGTFLKKQVPARSRILAPHEIIFYAGRTGAVYTLDRVWNSRERLLEEIKKADTGAFVYALSFHTREQVRLYETDPLLLVQLRSQYKKLKIGSYTLWLRKKHNDPTA